ncbi:MAG: serine/threonine protein kinase [Sandaracinaceae bacterium]
MIGCGVLPQIGDTLGEYRIVSHLSDGGMASLYLGRRISDESVVAIKVIHEHLSEDWQFVRMFIDEALISVRIRHPNVIRVDELGEENGVYFLAMEYVHGCSLAELLRAMSKKRRRMRPELAVHIASQVAGGLHAAHEMVGHDGEALGIVHRDVSPQNVLLSVDGRVVLLDFGIAKSKGRAERTEAGVIKGKVRYMAPEQALSRELDRRVDVYALGVMLWESLTMRRYIEGKTDIEIIRKVRKPDQVPPSQRAPGVPPALDHAVMKALSPEVEDRPGTAAEMKHMLEQVVPPTAVGPAHVAELLRLFVADQIAQAALSLPEEVGRPIAEQVRAQAPRENDEFEERTQTVSLRLERAPTREVPETVEIPSIPPGALSSPPGGPGAAPRPRVPQDDEGMRPTEAMEAVASLPSSSPPATLPSTPPANLDDRATVLDPSFMAAARIEIPNLPSHDEVPEEETLRASGSEIAAMLRGSVPDPSPGPVQVPITRVERPSAPQPPPPVEEAKRGPLFWALMVLGITLAAFIIGAGAAVGYVRFLR